MSARRSARFVPSTSRFTCTPWRSPVRMASASTMPDRGLGPRRRLRHAADGGSSGQPTCRRPEHRQSVRLKRRPVRRLQIAAAQPRHRVHAHPGVQSSFSGNPGTPVWRGPWRPDGWPVARERFELAFKGRYAVGRHGDPTGRAGRHHGGDPPSGRAVEVGLRHDGGNVRDATTSAGCRTRTTR